jgi:hypothetical protein
MSLCTACDCDCNLTFVCHSCLEVKRVCDSKVGGFDGKENICAACHLYRETGLKVTKSGRTRKARTRGVSVGGV